jgi:hypothetical protein
MLVVELEKEGAVPRSWLLLAIALALHLGLAVYVSARR